MKPLFSVGEEVILQSVNHRSYNGDTLVMEVVKDCKENLVNNQNLSGYHYKLQGKGSGWWYESALRKKYRPSDDSFENMITRLKNPIRSPQNHSEKSS